MTHNNGMMLYNLPTNLKKNIQTIRKLYKRKIKKTSLYKFNDIYESKQMLIYIKY